MDLGRDPLLSFLEDPGQARGPEGHAGTAWTILARVVTPVCTQTQVTGRTEESAQGPAMLWAPLQPHPL